MEFCSELALHALSDRGFEGLTERLIKAMSGMDVIVSLTASQEKDYGDAITPPIAEAQDEELEERDKKDCKAETAANKTRLPKPG